MAETVNGGRYKVGDTLVNAAGEEVKDTADSKPKSENGGSGGSLDGISFASEEAERLARENGLTSADFRGQEGSGSGGGFTKPDVQRISDARSS